VEVQRVVPVTFRVPVSLQKLTADKSRIEVEGGSIKQAVESLNSQYPGIRDSILDEKGNVRRFVNLFVNDEDIRNLQGENTPLKDGDQVFIVPAIAGGATWA
jgi:molybdopterin synthase sulfur carrier subunit